MPIESHCDVVLARVGEGRLRQHDACVFDGGAALLLLSALGAPRLWGYLLDATLEGFSEGLARPHDGRTSTRLHQGFDAARKRARARVDALLDRRPPDVGLLALGCDGPLLHVVCAGPQRAFVWRGGELRRLTPPDDRAHGLLKAPPSWSVEALEPGDLLLAGSLGATSESSLKRLCDTLALDPTRPVARLIPTLNEAAAEAGLSCAAAGMRIPKS
jgi:hypothetical protein